MVMSVQAKKGRRRLQMLNTENVIQLLDREKGLKRWKEMSSGLCPFFTLAHLLRLLISRDCFIWFPYIFLTSILIVCDREKQRERARRGSKRGKRFVASRLCTRGVWKSGRDRCWGSENEELWWGLCSMTGDVAKAILKSLTRALALPRALTLKIECWVGERTHINLSRLKWVLMDLTPSYFNHIACQSFYSFFWLN